MPIKPTILEAALERIRHFESQPHPADATWYGLDRPLRRLLDLPDFMPLAIVTTHGPWLTDVPAVHLQRAKVPALVDRESIRRVLADRHGRTAFVTGSLYVHHRMQQGIHRVDDATGTLAFPSHSSHHVISQMDWGAYADALAALPARYQPITVCLYWKDILLGCHEPFLQRGIPVVTAGHIFDPEFVQNLYTHLSRSRYACGNALGTHALLAIEMGIPYVDYGLRPVYDHQTGGDINAPKGVHTELDVDGEAKRDFYAMLPRVEDDPPVISERLAAHVDYLLGKNERIDIKQLRKVVVGQFLRINPAAREFFALLQKHPDLFEFRLVRRDAPETGI